MPTKKTNRGGRRDPVGGRPPKLPEQRKVKRTFTISKQNADWLEQQPNASQTVNDLLTNARPTTAGESEGER